MRCHGVQQSVCASIPWAPRKSRPPVKWYKIGREQLVPHDGSTISRDAELWEVYYYDYLALMTVDHPAGTEILVDERFVIPPAKLSITTVATPQAIAHAMDDNGQDVTDLISTLDGRAVSSFGRGQFQGVTRDSLP